MLDLNGLLPQFATANSTLLTNITPTVLSPPVYYTARPSLLSFISDKHLAIAAPVVAYWVLSSIFHIIDISNIPYFKARKIHESPEMLSRNKATVKQVVYAVIWQHVVQTILGFLWLDNDETILKRDVLRDHLGCMAQLASRVATAVYVLLGKRTGEQVLYKYGETLVRWVYWWGIPIAQIFFAFFIIDSWQYFWHRLCHTSRFLYRHFHSVHHRLYVPYAFGALYNHPLEGIVLDTMGAGVAEYLSGLTVRQACLLFAFSTMKTVDDHCGYRLWWDPCQLLFCNNVDYHDIHHQSYGIKANFSQPFFTNWDIILGTRMTREQAENRTKQPMKIE